MIVLTRLSGQKFVINIEKIRTIESTPDTVVCCESGDRLMVRETVAEVVDRAIAYAKVVACPAREPVFVSERA